MTIPTPDNVYEQLRTNIERGVVFLAMKYDGCNHGRFGFIKTVKQLDALVETMYKEVSNKHWAFTELARENPVTDGMVFAVNTPKLLATATTDDKSERLAYVLSIECFPCEKLVFEQVKDSDSRLEYLSTYYDETIQPRS